MSSVFECCRYGEWSFKRPRQCAFQTFGASVYAAREGVRDGGAYERRRARDIVARDAAGGAADGRACALLSGCFKACSLGL